jgi:hypothetical protein
MLRVKNCKLIQQRKILRVRGTRAEISRLQAMAKASKPRRCSSCGKTGHNKNSKKCPNFRQYQAGHKKKKKAVPPSKNPNERLIVTLNPRVPTHAAAEEEEISEEEQFEGNAMKFEEWEQVDVDEEILANHLGVVEIEGEFNDSRCGLIDSLSDLAVIDLYMHFLSPFIVLLIDSLNEIIIAHKISKTIVTQAMFLSFLAIYFHLMNFTRRNIAQHWSKKDLDEFVKSTKLSKTNFLSIFRALYHLPTAVLDQMEKSLNESFVASWISSRHVSIDEIMRKYKGRCASKVYEPSKPTKWGLKYYAMLDGHGWCSRFQRHRAGVKVVLKDLCEKFVTSLDQSLGSYCLFADNYYGSIQLGEKLTQLGHKFFFTMRKNRPLALWDKYRDRKKERKRKK